MAESKTKRLYGNLVSLKGPTEMPASDSIAALLGTMPRNADDSVNVPQGDDSLSERVHDLMLYDTAMTPDLTGLESIPSWALDTARLMRANQFANSFADKSLKRAIGKRGENDSNRMINAIQKQSGSAVKAAAMLARLRSAAKVKAVETDPFVRQLASNIEAMGTQDWANTLSLAQWLVSLEKQEREEQEQQDGEGEEGEKDDKPDRSKPGEQKAKGKGEAYEGKPDPRLDDDLQPNPHFKPAYKSLPGNAGHLENPERPDVLPMQNRRKKGGHRRAEIEGTIPKRFWRMAVDQKIFGGRVVKGGSKQRGTIMVDLSGSMGWTEHDIEAMIDVLPEATIIGYVGRSYDGDLEHNANSDGHRPQRGRTGRLVLLADRGRAARPEAVMQWSRRVGGDNIVDAPSLAILGSMTGPRVWISDGHVSGCSDGDNGGFTHGIQALCAVLQRRGAIVRCPNAQEAAAWLLKGRRPQVD